MGVYTKTGMSISERATLDNALAQLAAETKRRTELEDAVLELAELYAEQDDALVELAELMEE